MLLLPLRSTLFPTRRSSDLQDLLRARNLEKENSSAGQHQGHAARDHDDKHHLALEDRKSTRLNSSHQIISYAVFCLKKKKKQKTLTRPQLHLPIMYVHRDTS